MIVDYLFKNNYVLQKCSWAQLNLRWLLLTKIKAIVTNRHADTSLS